MTRHYQKSLYFLLACVLLFSRATNVLPEKCTEVNALGQKLNVCATLSSAPEPDCGLIVDLTVDGENVLHQNLDTEVSPRACGASKIKGMDCNICTELSPKPGDTQVCLIVSPTCGGFPFGAVSAGCFERSALDQMKSCSNPAVKCPADCSQKGTCNQGVCVCQKGYYGEDCSSQVQQFEQCQSFNEFTAPVCIKLTFDVDNCVMDFDAWAKGTALKIPTQTFPISTARAVFEEQQCFELGCGLCTSWDNLNLNSTHVGGCGTLAFNCEPLNLARLPLGCFDDVLLPKCFGNCPNLCSGRGVCNNGVCECVSSWTGVDCSSKKCPNNCSNRGTCVNGRCSCSIGWTGSDCSSAQQTDDANPGTSTEDNNTTHHGIGALGVTSIVFSVFLALGGAGAIVWYVIKKRADTSPQFSQLDLLVEEEGAELVD